MAKLLKLFSDLKRSSIRHYGCSVSARLEVVNGTVWVIAVFRAYITANGPPWMNRVSVLLSDAIQLWQME